MSNTTQTVVAEVVADQFVLSASQSEQVSMAAEMIQDAAFDFRKGCDMVGAILTDLKRADALTFASWEVVRVQFEKVAAVRARDNGAADPDGAGSDSWGRVTKFLAEFHSLSKPKAENKDAKRMAEKRKDEMDKAIRVADGRSSLQLENEKKALYAQATDEAIAQAKALEKVIKVVAKVEKEAVSNEMKPLTDSAHGHHKAIMEFMKAKNDPNLLADYVVLLKQTLDIWKATVK